MRTNNLEVSPKPANHAVQCLFDSSFEVVHFYVIVGILANLLVSYTFRKPGFARFAGLHAAG